MNTLFDLPPEPKRERITPQFLGCYRAGRQAFRVGGKRLPPYQPGGWGDNYRHYWRQGFDDAKAGRLERYES